MSKNIDATKGWRCPSSISVERSAYALSGGQRQRLCLARTLALRPDVILMDEPCSALDPMATAAIEKTVVSLAEAGICVIIVTHNIE